jgi:Circadian oscillating protein COP23
MNIRSSIIGTSISLLMISTCLQALPSLAQPKKVGFYCALSQDDNLTPVTMVGVGDSGNGGEHWKLVLWKNNYENMTPRERCERVSRRFQDAWDRHTFNHLMIGVDQKTGRGLICAVGSLSTTCNSKHVLFYVNNQQTAKSIIDELSKSLRKTAGKPIPQSGSNESIDMQELIDSMGK